MLVLVVDTSSWSRIFIKGTSTALITVQLTLAVISTDPHDHQIFNYSRESVPSIDNLSILCYFYFFRWPSKHLCPTHPVSARCVAFCVNQASEAALHDNLSIFESQKLQEFVYFHSIFHLVHYWKLLKWESSFFAQLRVWEERASFFK